MHLGLIEIAERIRSIALDCPSISDRLFDEASRIVMNGAPDNRTLDELSYLQDACNEIGERLVKLIKEVSGK